MENLVNSFENLRHTFANKKVLLTGHTGFKGSWMLKILQMLGAEITGYALTPNSSDDLYNLINGDKLCTSEIADLRDREKLKEVIVGLQPDFVFHLAAQPLVRLSYEIPSETFEINAIGTANLLDGLRLVDKKCTVVLITTDKVYHNNEWLYPYREDDKLGGFDPYSASKACTELVINSYRNSFFNLESISIHKKAIAVGRAGNVIGGGDWSKDRLIPDIAKALTNDQVIHVRNPAAVRPWQHVLEPVLAYLLLAMHMNTDPEKYSQAYNFGPQASDALTVEQMLNLAISCWGSGEYVFEQVKGQPHEAGLLKLDISKATHELSWKPKMNASEAVKMTMDWYHEFAVNAQGINDFTEKQIMDYINA